MKQKLGVTLFEDQLVRYYLTGDNGKFFAELTNTFDITIFTNSQLVEFIKRFLNQNSFEKTQVIVFNAIPDNGLARLCGFFLHWSLPSGTTRVKLNRQPRIKRLIGRIVLRRLSNSLTLRATARYLYHRSFSRRCLKSRFQGVPKQLDAIFITSLTNNYEDVRVAHYFSRFERVATVGTIRSWDNLTSHGCLRLIPNKFLSHSPFTDEKFTNLQLLHSSLVSQWRVPAYGGEAILRRDRMKQIDTRKKFVTYASMGLTTNPDDKNFIEWLVDFWDGMPESSELTILQHPKFSFDIQSKKSNIKIKKFGYLDSSLQEYYEFLRSQHFVLCGGTSVILDCLFTSTPAVLIGFEIVKQPHWSSALRYLDSIDHTRELISHAKLSIANSKEQLEAILNGTSVPSGAYEGAGYFLGNTDIDVAKTLVRTIERTFTRN